jgi:glycosyltransferase involved in cell wall biosynthesis
MKILLSAIACNPITGSEAAVGWTVASILAQRHDVHVLTHEHNRVYFEEWLKTYTLPENLHLHYFGRNKPHHPNRLIARINSVLDNYSWHSKLLEPARELHRQMQFDLTHHVTYSTWRVASPLWQLDIPLIWGPLGGGELFPWRFAKILSPGTLFFEVARGLSGILLKRNLKIKKCAAKAAACIAGNRETYRQLCSLRGTNSGVHSLCNSFFKEKQIAEFNNTLQQRKPNDSLRIFSGGSLGGQKGVAITLQALAALKRKGIAFKYRLGGTGSELGHLRKLAGQLGISENITFGETLAKDDYREELGKSDVYLLPSLRENAGITLMEAMLAGCVPIVANCGGPGEIVTDECGFRVPITTPQTMADEISNILQRLNADFELLSTMGKASHKRIATGYSEEKYLQSIEDIYSAALRVST